MICAEIAAEHARKALDRGNLSADQLASYGVVFQETFGRLHRAARFARKFMEIQPFVNRTMHRAQHDAKVAITLSKLIRGVASPLSLMTPGMSLRVLMG
jgi:flavin-dependent dehydrogenase